MKYSVTMGPHEGAPLDRWEIHDFVLPPLVHCVLYCEHRSKLALPPHLERKSESLILFFHLKYIYLKQVRRWCLYFICSEQVRCQSNSYYSHPLIYVVIRAYSYSDNGTGAIILTKVVLGTVYNVSAFNEVMSCPPGHNSVRTLFVS